jgi:hypothetical protein
MMTVLGFSCVYYYLHGRLQESNVKLERALQSLRAETQERLSLAQQVTMTHLLDAWHSGRSGHVRLIARYFSRGTREEKATRFLLDSRPLTEKVTEFREKLQETEPYFAQFVIAEHYLKDGERAEAIEAFRKCLSTASDPKKDKWLELRSKIRLYDLTGRKPDDLILSER